MLFFSLGFFYRIYFGSRLIKPKSFLANRTRIRIFIVSGFVFEGSENDTRYQLSSSLYTEVRGEK